MNASGRRTLTMIGMGLVASATVGLSASAASASTVTDTAVPTIGGHTTEAGHAGTAIRSQDHQDDHASRNDRNNDHGHDNQRDNDRRGHGARDHDRHGHGDHDHGRGQDHRRWGNGHVRTAWHGHARAQSYTVAYYRGRHACETAGHIGERRGYWDDSDCLRLGHSNIYGLQVVEYHGRHRHI
jgi:hypothetical protein